jgi:hypothetical protein
LGHARNGGKRMLQASRSALLRRGGSA